MNCSKYPPMLSRLLDGELSPPEEAEVQSHLLQCAGCRALLANWRLQGICLRRHLHRHSLGEDFVARAVRAVPAAPLKETIDPAPGRSRAWWRWLEVAAAVATIAVALALYFSARNGVSYARVVEPGGLEVLQSSAWMRATAGELLHPGDCLRNAVPGAPEILWRDECKLTLQTGTLAQISAGGPEPGQVVLMSGSLASEIRAGGREFRVWTPAGAVSASAGSFTVRVTDFALPQIKIAADRSEILSGSVAPIGQVSVAGGAAQVQLRQSRHEVGAGKTAVFARSGIISAGVGSASIDTSLRFVPGASGTGVINTTLAASRDDLRIGLEFANVSLKKVLEWAAASEVHGGEDLYVAGTLRFPANASPESIVSAVGNALDVPVSFRMEKASRIVASTRIKPAAASASEDGVFLFRRTPDGAVSFKFDAVPAGQVFRILRTVVPGIPDLSAEESSIPISIQASSLRPDEAAAWINKTLGLQFKSGETQVGVVDVGPVPETAPSPDLQAPGRQQLRIPKPESAGPTRDKDRSLDSAGDSPVVGAADATAADRNYYDASPRVAEGRPLWSVLGGNPGFMSMPLVPGGKGADTSVADGKAKPKPRQFFGIAELFPRQKPSTHLIWPALDATGAAGAEPAYLVANDVELPVRTLWKGYDRNGNLVDQYAYLVEGASTLTLLPNRDLPTFLGEGGHWETLSNLPLTGFREPGNNEGLGLPVNPAQAIRQWAIPSAWLGMGARVWVANPSGTDGSVLVTVMRNGREFAAEQIEIPAHGGATWPEFSSGLGNGMTVVVRVLRGSIAGGLR